MADYLDIELENLKKKTQNIENQQNEAISKENFEEADQLEIILKQHHESVFPSPFFKTKPKN